MHLIGLSHLWLFLITLSCAFTSVAQAAEPTLGEVVGTWRWISVNGKSVEKQPFYMRLESDGAVHSWPTMKEVSDEKGVSHGRFTLTGRDFVIESETGNGLHRAILRLKENRMILKAGSLEFIYRRVENPQDPGYLENRKPAGFLKVPF